MYYKYRYRYIVRGVSLAAQYCGCVLHICISLADVFACGCVHAVYYTSQRVYKRKAEKRRQR